MSCLYDNISNIIKIAGIFMSAHTMLFMNGVAVFILVLPCHNEEWIACDDNPLCNAFTHRPLIKIKVNQGMSNLTNVHVILLFCLVCVLQRLY